MNALKLMVRQSLEKLKAFDYTRSQNLHIDCRYDVDGNTVRYYILPLPLETGTQKTISPISLIPSATKFIERKSVYKAAVYDLGRLSERRILLRTDIRTEPLVYRQKQTYRLSDYLKPETSMKDARVNAIVRGVVGKENDLFALMRRLYEYVLEKLVYDNPIEGLYTYREALKKKRVDCGGFASLLSALLSGAGIPNRLVAGFLKKKGSRTNLSMHAWLEAVLPDGSVFPMDPSVEWRRRRGQTARYGGFGYVGSDRVVTSYGTDHRLLVGGKIYSCPILQNPFKL